MLLLTEHDLIIRQALVATQGREVKHTGDGIMASLNDVGHALDCSVAIQDGFDARSAGARRPTCACGSEWQAARPSNAMTTTEQGFAFDQPEDKVLKRFTDPTRVFELLRTRH